ncbi:MAG: dTDP-glucose 4,6-dehydratase [Candidatus Paracaedibacter sp.]
MKILVTGGAGFIGSNFVCDALEQGHQVVNIDKLTYAGNLGNLGSYSSHKNHIFYKEDICHKNGIEQIIMQHQPDVILHMAAESHVDRSIDCADDFIRTNVMGTHQLLDVTLKYYKNLDDKERFRFIHLSTDEVFGALGPTGKFHETMPYRPNSPYAASKASSDLLVRSYHQTYGLPTLIVNASNNYGSKQYPEKLIPLTILNALENKPLPIYGDGQQMRDWLYVIDHVQALHAVINFGRIGESYCVGADNEMANLILVEKICIILDELRPGSLHGSYKSLITFVKDRPGHDFRYATDASKLKQHTGWAPKISFEEGLRATIQWYLDSDVLIDKQAETRKRIGLGKIL